MLSVHRFGCARKRFQLRNSLAPQPVQFAHRQNDFAFQKILQLAEFEGRAAQPPKLFAQKFRS